MSKSAASAYNYISLTDSPDEIRRKIRRAVTDSGAEVRPGPDKPALTNLLTIFSLLAGESAETIVARYEGRGYADFKVDLGDVVVESLAPFQRRMTELAADKGFTLDVLRDGAERAQAIAERTIAKVRDRMGFVPSARLAARSRRATPPTAPASRPRPRHASGPVGPALSARSNGPPPRSTR